MNLANSPAQLLMRSLHTHKESNDSTILCKSYINSEEIIGFGVERWKTSTRQTLVSREQELKKTFRNQWL